MKLRPAMAQACCSRTETQVGQICVDPSSQTTTRDARAERARSAPATHRPPKHRQTLTPSRNTTSPASKSPGTRTNPEGRRTKAAPLHNLPNDPVLDHRPSKSPDSRKPPRSRWRGSARPGEDRSAAGHPAPNQARSRHHGLGETARGSQATLSATMLLSSNASGAKFEGLAPSHTSWMVPPLETVVAPVSE